MLTIFNSLIRGLIFIYKILARFFYYIFLPLKFIFNLLFKYLLVPFYKIYLKIKNKNNGDTEKKNFLFSFIINKNAIHLLIIFACFLIVINNLSIKTVLAEDLGKNSVIFALAQGDEFSEITEEALVPITGHDEESSIFRNDSSEKNQNLDSQATSTPTSTTGSILDSSLTKNTQIVTKDVGVDQMLARVENGINADAVIKTSSPETETVPKPREEAITYTVEAGDTISSIAAGFGVSINTVLWENKISGLSVIRPGDQLTILPISGVSHTVAKNETLSSIASEYSSEVDDILDYNKLVSADQLQIGQKLIIPGGSITPPKRSISSISSVFSSSGSVGSSSRRIGGFIWPTTSKRITQYYHWRHHAIDIGGKTGTPVYASMSGKIVKAGWSTGYGYNIIIDHSGGKKTLYAHLSKFYASYGQQVTQGDSIGAVGSTGWSTGPHLHFEIIINGKKVNPLSYL